ncbi:MAG: hypothetical protein GF387_01915 [Candidatus Portnoybacteria bacterium]|nr:hypothetical protein [Candidatus Portnoybacteria bacterium]
MNKKLLVTAVFVAVLFFPPLFASASIVINEIAWMGTEISANDEWIELHNLSSSSVDITGWVIEAEDGSPLINLSGNIPAMGYFLLERTDDNSVIGIDANQIYAGALENGGESLILKDSQGIEIDSVSCTDEWLAGDNSSKQTMERKEDGWQNSASPGGTPGVVNSEGGEIISEEENEEDEEGGEEKEENKEDVVMTDNAPVADAGNNIIGFVGQEIVFDGSNSSDKDGDELAYFWNMGNGDLVEEVAFDYSFSYSGTYLVTLMVYDGHHYSSDTITVKINSYKITINEFIPNPEGPDSELEWIEIYNGGNSVADISGWQLDDEEGGSKAFVFPENTLIGPGSYIVFDRKVTKIALNNDQDKVRLLLPEGVVFEEISYSDAKEKMSCSRVEGGFVWSVPTPGTSNVFLQEQKEDKDVVFQSNARKSVVGSVIGAKDWSFQDVPKESVSGYIAIEENKEVEKDTAAVGSFGNIEEKKPSSISTIILIIFSITALGLIVLRLFKKPERESFP